MIRYIKHQQINKEMWDATIRQSANGMLYGYSWYLDIVCENWDALVVDDYAAVMPVTKGRKYLMDYMYPPFFTQQLGVFSKNPVTEELCLQFLKSIPATYRYIQMNLNASNLWVDNSFTTKRNKNFILNLDTDYDSIWSKYSENHQRNIRKAQKNNLSIFKTANVKDVIEMFRNNRGRFLTNLQNEHYAMFTELEAQASQRKMSKVWLVNDKNGIPVAGAVFFEDYRTSIFIFSGVTKEGKSLSAMHFLVDAYIKEQSSTLKTLDFEGSNDPDLARFYKGFGSKEIVYLQISKNQLPPPWKWFKN